MQHMVLLLAFLISCFELHGSAQETGNPVPIGVFRQFCDNKQGSFYRTSKNCPLVNFENPSTSELEKASEFCRHDIVDRVFQCSESRKKGEDPMFINFFPIFNKVNVDNVQLIEESAKKVGLDTFQESRDYMYDYGKFIMKGKKLDPDINIKLSVFSPIEVDKRLTFMERDALFNAILGPKGGIGTNYYELSELSESSEKYTFECALFVLFFPPCVINSPSSFLQRIFFNYFKEKEFYHRCLCGAIRKFMETVDGIMVKRYSPTARSDVSTIAAYYKHHFKSGKGE